MKRLTLLLLGLALGVTATARAQGLTMQMANGWSFQVCRERQRLLGVHEGQQQRPRELERPYRTAPVVRNLRGAGEGRRHEPGDPFRVRAADSERRRPRPVRRPDRHAPGLSNGWL